MKKSYIVGGIIVVAAMAMAMFSFQSTLTAYVSVSEAKVSNRPVQVAGMVVKGTKRFDLETNSLVFTLKEDSGERTPVAGVVLTMDGDTCKDIKITLGAVAPTPIRAKKTEELVKGKTIDEGLLEEAGKIASGEATPIDDVRGSAFYRTEIVNVYTKRAIRQALEQAK